MSTRIEVGRYVAFRRPSAAMGWWIGLITGCCGSGFFEVLIVWSEHPNGSKSTSINKVKTPAVGFCSFKEAYSFTRRKKRAWEFEQANKPVEA